MGKVPPIKLEADIAALKGAIKALRLSTSRRMLKANLEFIWDYCIAHPSPELPKRLQP